MIEHQVNQQAVHQILHHMAQMTAQGQYTTADLLIAVAEFLGRMIVQTAETPISGVQMAQVMEAHIKRTLHAGYAAKGFHMGMEDIEL